MPMTHRPFTLIALAGLVACTSADAFECLFAVHDASAAVASDRSLGALRELSDNENRANEASVFWREIFGRHLPGDGSFVIVGAWRRQSPERRIGIGTFRNLTIQVPDKLGRFAYKLPHPEVGILLSTGSLPYWRSGDAIVADWALGEVVVSRDRSDSITIELRATMRGVWAAQPTNRPVEVEVAEHLRLSVGALGAWRDEIRSCLTGR
jgi:hypothetical protein